jgi:hypothetical protein
MRLEMVAGWCALDYAQLSTVQRADKTEAARGRIRHPNRNAATLSPTTATRDLLRLSFNASSRDE